MTTQLREERGRRVQEREPASAPPRRLERLAQAGIPELSDRLAAAVRTGDASLASAARFAAHLGSAGAVAPVQRLARRESDDETVRGHAAAGTREPGGALPYLDRLQAAFGRHDLSEIRAHVGERARASAAGMGAEAYAMGSHIVFGGSVDLWTAAHEATHVIQQRHGWVPSGGVGRVGDAFERHADAVASAVVAGGNVEGLLDRVATDGTPSVAVQQTPQTRPFAAEAMGTGEAETVAFMRAVYTAQLGRGRGFRPELEASDLSNVEGRNVHREIAADLTALFTAARAELAAAQADENHADHARAANTESIGLASGYRTLREERSAWNQALTQHLSRTEATRMRLPDGPLGATAQRQAVAWMRDNKAVPGFSNHSAGRAVDFSTRLSRPRTGLGPNHDLDRLWAACWLSHWLRANAGRFNFHPLSSEYWHWDHRGGAAHIEGDAACPHCASQAHAEPAATTTETEAGPAPGPAGGGEAAAQPGPAGAPEPTQQRAPAQATEGGADQDAQAAPAQGGQEAVAQPAAGTEQGAATGGQAAATASSVHEGWSGASAGRGDSNNRNGQTVAVDGDGRETVPGAATDAQATGGVLRIPLEGIASVRQEAQGGATAGRVLVLIPPAVARAGTSSVGVLLHLHGNGAARYGAGERGGFIDVGAYRMEQQLQGQSGLIAILPVGGGNGAFERSGRGGLHPGQLIAEVFEALHARGRLPDGVTYSGSLTMSAHSGGGYEASQQMRREMGGHTEDLDRIDHLLLFDAIGEQDSEVETVIAWAQRRLAQDRDALREQTTSARLAYLGTSTRFIATSSQETAVTHYRHRAQLVGAAIDAWFARPSNAEFARSLDPQVLEAWRANYRTTDGGRGDHEHALATGENLRNALGRVPVQRKARGSGASPGDDSASTAQAGFRGPGEALPHLDAIQAAFGGHAVRDVRAHQDAPASAAARQLGAAAFASGERVAFAERGADLHTAAHEAAHVVQQRSGVALGGAVGAAGDRYERQADAVADAVVSGQSAERLLGPVAPGRAAAGPIQRIPGEAPARATDRRTAAGQLRTQVNRIRTETISEREAHRTLIRARREHWVVGPLSEVAGNAGALPDDTIWEPILAHLHRADDAVAGYQGAADGGESFLDTVRRETRAARDLFERRARQIRLYRERVEDGAESHVESLEIVIATCALVFTICATAAALPLVTGGGLAGANAAGATALGTASGTTGGIAATSATGVGVQAVGAGVGAGTMAGTTTVARQTSEIATGQRDRIDVQEVYAATTEAAAQAVMTTLLGGALSHRFVTPLTARIVAFAEARGATVAAQVLTERGANYVLELLAGVANSAFTTAVSRFIERTRVHPPANQASFLSQLIEDVVQGNVVNMVIAAATHAGTRAQRPTAAPSPAHRSVVIDPANPGDVSTRIPTTSGRPVNVRTPEPAPTPAPAAGPTHAPTVAAHEPTRVANQPAAAQEPVAAGAARTPASPSHAEGDAPTPTREQGHAPNESTPAREDATRPPREEQAVPASPAAGPPATAHTPPTVEQLRERGGRHRDAVAVGEPNSQGMVPIMRPHPGFPGAMTVEWIEPRVTPRGRVTWDEVSGTSVHLRVQGDSLEIIMMNSTGRLQSSRSVPEAARLAGCPRPRTVTSTRIVAQSGRSNPGYQNRLQAAPLNEHLTAEQVREIMDRGPFIFFAGFGARITGGTVIEASGGRTMRFDLEY